MVLLSHVLLYTTLMTSQDLIRYNLPDAPGVYFFRTGTGEILYIGKATSLRDRVRSYFRDDVLRTRGKRILDMVTQAGSLTWTTTDSVLEALVLEAALIKKELPKYNVDEKDDKTWNWVVITREEFPVVTTIRERLLPADLTANGGPYLYAFGPFPSGSALREALTIIRRILPFRDEKCHPPRSGEKGKPCFARQIGLCPGVCTGEITQAEYQRAVRHVALFFSGKKGALITMLEKEMTSAAKKLAFEEAGVIKRQIAALRHIKDASLVGQELKDTARAETTKRRAPFRIEAYDIAHISGTHTVGVMVVIEDGAIKSSDYRKFKIRGEGKDRSHDIANLSEVLTRRLGHSAWRSPDLIVVDGSIPQKRAAEKVLRGLGFAIPVIAVVKDERHKPKALIGAKELTALHKQAILLSNAEAHRFAVAYHRQLREKMPSERKRRG